MSESNAKQNSTTPDAKWQANVHPPDWKNPAAQDSYQLVVIGAGTAGLVAAAGAAGLGARVALIERELMGGDCLNFGCVPSKALIRSSRSIHQLHVAAEFGVKIAEAFGVEFDQVMERMRRLRAQISPADSAARFQELGVDVFFGSARFVGENKIQVVSENGGGADLIFKKALIATGASPTVPSIPGLESVEYLTNQSLFSLTQLPRRFGIIGAGPIGVEIAQAFARFGSEVLLFESGDRILGKEDEDAASIVQQRLLAEGVQFFLGSRQQQIESAANDSIRLQGNANGGSYIEQVDQLLVAVGRTPNLAGLGLESVAVKHDRHGIKVDRYLRTSNPRIYAAGDVCSAYQLTHAADFQARTVLQNALFALGPFGKKNADALLIPRVTYCSPEVAQVGMDAETARGKGIEIETFQQSLSDVDRAVLDGEDLGFVKVHVRKGTDKIIGAVVVSAHAGEMISEITLAMTQGIGLSKIASTIHPYPTQAEAIRKLGDQYNRTRLGPFASWVLKGLLRWNAGR